ncbi:hypothetical protein SARC_10894 [Sphaeroforma arctica JP610]|uniref:Uncharacterized protein n=1 Tax=Sphaeroforma arctica JP610 TaxID=667725 RepID=A0A0L0FJI4_9EUKA|nr:hypothetical protein SARC_10894 [Sphaeroforma arctica JP610]KNC76611.1 hypothetical protein SARC_10894 [Sphaeroforma arctica JP610]|eukprot:XP_014150513.1 hypothetical protein SARC_10894 [Sphaeroforma arctica JP610]
MLSTICFAAISAIGLLANTTEGSRRINARTNGSLTASYAQAVDAAICTNISIDSEPSAPETVTILSTQQFVLYTESVRRNETYASCYPKELGMQNKGCVVFASQEECQVFRDDLQADARSMIDVALIYTDYISVCSAEQVATNDTAECQAYIVI